MWAAIFRVMRHVKIDGSMLKTGCLEFPAMYRVRSSRLVAILALSSISLVTRAQQQTTLSGFVESPDGKRITHTEVRVDGGPETVTTDTGEFVFALNGFTPGTQVILHVKGWVVLEPFIGQRGCLYVPKDHSQQLSVIVVKPGDQALLSPLQIQQITRQLSQRGGAPGEVPVPGSNISAEAHELGVTARELSDAINNWRSAAQQLNQYNVQNDFNQTVQAATDKNQSIERRITAVIALGRFWNRPTYEKELGRDLSVLVAARGSEDRPLRCMAASVIGEAISGFAQMHGGADEGRSKRISQLLYGSRTNWSIGFVTKSNYDLRIGQSSILASNDCLSELDATREAIRKNWEYLRGVNLNDTDLRNIQLYSADLEGASLMRTEVKDANFECANLQGTTFEQSNWTAIKKINSANVRDAIPMEFRKWAISREAKDMGELEWASWTATRPECVK
jgi:hypothetical protein